MKKIGAGIALVLLFALSANSAKAISLSDLEKTVQSLESQVGSLQSQLGLAINALQNSTMAAPSSSVSANATTTNTTAGTGVSPSSYTNGYAVNAGSSAWAANSVPPILQGTTGTTTAAGTTTGGANWTVGTTVVPTTVSGTTTVVNPADPNAVNNSYVPTAAATAPAAFVITPAALGSYGADVTVIQNVLISQGLLTGPATGNYGSLTQAAVSSFQAKNNLTVVGNVGPQTAALLNTLNASVNTSAHATSLEPLTGTVWVSRNMAYGDQYVAPHTLHEKIGSLLVHNGTSESVKLNSMLIGFTTGGAGSVTNLSNMTVSVNSVGTGITLGTVSTYNTMTASTTIASGTSATVDIYADMGSATSGGIRSNLLAGAIGLSTGTSYSSGSSYSAQDIESTPTPPCAIAAFTASPTSVTSGSASTLSWNTTNCTSASLIGPSVSTSLLSGSITTGPVIGSSTYTLTANGLTGGIVSASVVVTVGSSGYLSAAKNTVYTDQTVAPSTVHQKIGSYTTSNSTTETVNMTTLKAGLTVSGGMTLSNLSNVQAYVNGVAVGVALPATSIVTFSTGNNLPAGMSETVDFYADIAAASGTIQTTLQAQGTGVSTSATYTTGGAVLGQIITVSGTCSVTPTFNVSASSVSQYVPTGTTISVTDATQATFTLSSPTPTTVTQLKMTVSGASSATAARIGSSNATFVGGVAYFTGLSIAIPAGGAGTNVTVYLSYPPVGPTGVASGTTSTASLTYLKFTCGSITNSSTVSVAAPTMTLVASAPAVSATAPSGLLTTGNLEVIDVSVAANPFGAIKLNSLPFSLGGGGYIVNTAANTVVVKNSSGVVLPTTNTAYSFLLPTTVTFTGGYAIPAGSVQTFKIFVPITAITNLPPTAMLQAAIFSPSTGFSWTDTAGGATLPEVGMPLVVGYPNLFTSNLHN